MTLVKICGITDHETLKAACNAGARFIGFVFYPPSPRNISPQNAADLIRQIPSGVRAVGLFVDPTDQALEMTLSTAALDMIQLHGEESQARVTEIKNRFNLPIIKAVRIADETDIQHAHDYEDIADWILFDYKSDKEKGGTGESFDWNLLAKKSFKKPIMLSGGLNADNVKQAIEMLKPDAVDVSSGVESSKGVKDITKIKNFINEVKSNV